MSTSLFLSNGTHFYTTSTMNGQGTIDYNELNVVVLTFMTSSTVWGYFCANLAIGELIIHVISFYGKDMIQAWKQARSRTIPDIHYQAMLKYKELPM